MGHEHDSVEPLRRRLIPKIGLVTAFLEEITGKDCYVTTETRDNQFVGRVLTNEEQFEKELHGMGFERNPASSLKHHFRTSEVDEGSFRKTNGDKQLHIVLYDGEEIENANGEETFVYAHWEYRWDKYPIKHYRGEDINVKIGVDRMRRLLEDNGIAYDHIQP